MEELHLNYEVLKKIEQMLAKDDSTLNNFYIEKYLFFLKDKMYLNLFKSIYNELSAIENSVVQTHISSLDFRLLKIANITKNSNFLKIYIALIITKSFSTTNKITTKNKLKIMESDVLINEIVRHLNNLFIFLIYKHNVEIEFNSKILRKIIWYVLEKLSIKGLLNRKNIRYSRKKSMVVFNLTEEYEVYNDVEIYFSNFITNTINNTTYVINNHHSSIKKLFIENAYSDKCFEFDPNDASIKNLLDTYSYIDRKSLEEIIWILKNHHKIYAKNTKQEYRIAHNFLILKINEKDLPSIKELSKKLSLYENIIKLEEVLKIKFDNKKIYFPTMFDFRSRKYDLSDISPTFNKEFRYCLYNGFYKKEDQKKKHHLNFLIDDTISKYHYKTKLLNINLNEKTDLNSIIWILISIGEIFKNQLGKKVHIESFIEHGIKYFNKRGEIIFDDPYDKIKFNYLCKVIKEIANESNKKWLISKDATGSCFQHLIKILGPKNTECLKICNLQSKDTWYDPYQYIIDDFKNSIQIENNLKLNKKKFETIFNRKNLKKTIMTENYSAGESLCLEYFKESILFENYTIEEKNEIIKIFKLFYTKIHEHSILFNTNPDFIRKIMKNHNYELSFIDGGKIYLFYFLTAKKEINIFEKNKRFTKTETYLTTINDDKKIYKSLIANVIQALDASLVRWILKTDSIITIHDCFMIDYKNITYLISKLNEGMALEFHLLEITKFTDARNIEPHSIYSIFIVI